MIGLRPAFAGIAQSWRTICWGLVIALSGLIAGAIIVRPPSTPDAPLISPVYAYDTSDPTLLLGDADFVVVGTVASNLGPIGDMQTAFEVDVILELKGTTPEKIVVRQLGVSGEDQQVIVEGVQSFEVGATYVFPLNITDLGTDHLVSILSPLDLRAAPAAAPLWTLEALADARRPDLGQLTQAAEDALVNEWLSSRPGYSTPSDTRP